MLGLNWNEWATLISAIGAFGAAVAALLGVWENRKQRNEAQRPALAFDSKEIWLEWDPDAQSYRKKDNGRVINIFEHNLEMKVHNIGRGPAKEVNYEWNFDEKAIDRINLIKSPLVEIEKSQARDDKGRLYYYQIKAFQEYSGIEEGEFAIHPFGDNQHDPAYLYETKHVHYRVDGESSVAIGKDFGRLSLAYAIAMTDTNVDEEFDWHYKPNMDFEIEYRNNSNKPQKQLFTISCQIYIGIDENGTIDGKEKPPINLMYQIYER